MMPRALLALVTVGTGCLVAACGSADSDPPGATAGAGEWRTERLEGTVGADLPTVLATDGDDALVAMTADDGTLRSHVSVAGDAFRGGEPLETGVQWLVLADAVRHDGDWYALGSGGVRTVDGDEEMLFDPVAFRSPDGRSWERVDVTGFAGPVDVSSLVVVDGRLVAVGAYRTEGAMGGFEAHAWVSDDGARYAEVDLPGVPAYRSYDDESSAGHLAVVDGALLAAGRVGDRAALWRSADGGSTWQAVDATALRGVHSVSGLRGHGPTIVASVVGATTQALRSDDGGRSWEPVSSLTVDGEAETWAPLWAGAGTFFTLTGIDDASWSDPEVCYADLARCGRDPGPQLVASGDGTGWAPVDGPGGEVDTVTGTADGRVLVLTGARGGVEVHTWPAGVELPTADVPEAPERVELVTLAEGEEPEVGVRYHHLLSTHCGIGWTWFGDGTWRRTDDGPDYETGAGDEPPPGWPVPPGGGAVYGYATVLADGTLEYTDGDGSVLATYERRSGAPWCD